MAVYRFPFHGTYRLTCAFGKKGNWQCGWHTGVDYVGDSDRDVYAISSGKVTKVGSSGSYGNHVYVAHDDGMLSVYAHLRSVAVTKGQRVSTATKLGVMGSTGNANGAHLHLELHRGSYRYPPSPAIDPNAHIRANLQPTEPEQKQEEKKTMEKVKIKINGIGLPAEGFLHDGLTYAPLRALGNALGLTVGWQQTPMTASLDEVPVTVCVDGDYVEGGFLRDDTSFAPVRAVAEALGAEVTWNDEDGIVDIHR